MKFKYTILYVEDVAKSLEFYERAFGFKRKMLHEGGDFGELQTGDTILSFSSIKLMTDLGKTPAKANATAPTFGVSFEATNVRQALDRAVAAGATLEQDLSEESWGQTTSYVSDPDGFLIEICSPVMG